ncbi:MAG TPA: hypothetical protein VJ863_01240 [Sphaerochaeta sp.]|nr:hypothetical protein [Sphaerochaeta sp.]
MDKKGKFNEKVCRTLIDRLIDQSARHFPLYPTGDLHTHPISENKIILGIL